MLAGKVIRSFLWMFATAFAIIALSHLLRGRPLEQALTEGLLWSATAAAIFAGARAYRLRKGQACALCGDTSETPAPERDRRT